MSTSEMNDKKLESLKKGLNTFFAIKSSAFKANSIINKNMGFPYTKPTFPNSVDLKSPKFSVGVDYDTSWARKRPARIVRKAITDLVMGPVVKFIAAPQILGSELFEEYNGPFIFTANHASHLDTGLLISSLPEHIRHKTVAAAAADYFFDTKLKAHLAAGILNAIPMERVKVNRTSALFAAELIEEGWNLIIFPEGGRTPDGWGQEWKGGAAYLSIKTNAPIVPIYLDGTRNLLGKGSKKLTTGATKIVFGKPMYASAKEDSRKFAKRVEDKVAMLADESQSGFFEARLRASKGKTPSLEGGIDSKWLRSWTAGKKPHPTLPKKPKWPK